MCQVVPVPVDDCQKFVDENVEKLYQLLREEVTVDHICKGLHVCGQQMRALAVNKDRSQRCILCHTFAEFVFVELKDNRTEAAILNSLDKVCSLVPQHDRTECKNMINTYLGMLIELFKTQETPDDVCRMLRLCASASPKASECDLCKVVADWVLDEVEVCTYRKY